MKISLIVPAYNEEKLLPETLRSLRDSAAAFHEAGWQTETIVCDNNSTDRTAEIAREAGARVVFEPVNQIARARNAGAAAASGNWLVFVDADSTPSPALFHDVADVIRSGRCLAGGSTIAMESGSFWMRLGVAAWNGVSRLTRWAAGSFMFCETAAFREIGGFSRELYVSEELDLFRRLKRLARRRGKSIRILRRHPLRSSDRKARLYGARRHALFLAKLLLRGGRTVRRPEDCFMWYDGRR